MPHFSLGLEMIIVRSVGETYGLHTEGLTGVLLRMCCIQHFPTSLACWKVLKWEKPRVSIWDNLVLCLRGASLSNWLASLHINDQHMSSLFYWHVYNHLFWRYLFALSCLLISVPQGEQAAHFSTYCGWSLLILYKGSSNVRLHHIEGCVMIHYSGI